VLTGPPGAGIVLGFLLVSTGGLIGLAIDDCDRMTYMISFHYKPGSFDGGFAFTVDGARSG
jgi:hypothetical protein